MVARSFLSALACSLLVFSGSTQAADARQIIAAKCADCHGHDGNSSNPAIPRLAGLNPAYVVKQMKEFSEGRRRNDDMTPLAGELGDDGMQAVAGWYSSRKPLPGKPGDAKLAEVGRQIYEEGNGDPAVQACASCHQPDGAGNARFPRLAGQHKNYIQKQLTEFKAGRRATDPQMTTIAQRLNPQEIRTLAEYISGL